MKKTILVITAILLVIVLSGCSASERITEDVYVDKLFANQIGSLDDPVQDLYVDNTTLYIGGVPFTGEGIVLGTSVLEVF